MSEPRFQLIPFGEEDNAWPHLRAYFERLTAKVPDTRVTPDRIIERAKRRELMRWQIQQGWCLTGVAASGEIIEAVVGDRMAHWLGPGLADFEQRARRRGFDRIRGGGRPGWIRELKRRGYVKDAGGFEKRL